MRSNQKNSKDIGNAIFSLESEDGRLLSDSQAGPRTKKSGQAAPPASHSPKLEKGKWTETSATFGPLFEPLSPSADLQYSLESKLRARMAAYGSPEYELTWKNWDIVSGPPICALRASPRRWFPNAFIGWPRPTVNDAKNNASPSQFERNSDALNVMAVKLSGWVRPTTMDGSRGIKPPRPTDTGVPLSQQVGEILAGWTRPKTQTGGPNSKRKERGAGGPDLQELARQVMGWARPTAVTPTWWSGPLQNGWNAIEAEIERGGRKYRAQWRVKPGLSLLADGLPDFLAGLLAQNSYRQEIDDKEIKELIELAEKFQAKGLPGRVSAISGFGNAIVPQLAAEFIGAYMDLNDGPRRFTQRIT